MYLKTIKRCRQHNKAVVAEVFGGGEDVQVKSTEEESVFEFFGRLYRPSLSSAKPQNFRGPSSTAG